jgi:hypothetical protein
MTTTHPATPTGIDLAEKLATFSGPGSRASANAMHISARLRRGRRPSSSLPLSPDMTRRAMRCIASGM